MKNSKGQFVDGEEGKEFRFKPRDKRLLGNQWRKGHKPTNAFPKGKTPANYKGLVPRLIGSRKELIVTIPHKVLRANKKGELIQVKQRTSFARYVYSKNFGKIPKGNIIFHLNHNPYDNEPKNLIAIPRAYLIRLNNNRVNIDDIGKYRR